MENEKLEIVKITTGVITSIVTSLFGGMDDLFIMLLIMIVVDFISGMLKAIYKKEIDSNKFFMGGMRKVSILLVVVVSTQIDVYMGVGISLRTVTITYYIISEGLSFIENISVYVDLPEGFIEYFKKEEDDELWQKR